MIPLGIFATVIFWTGCCGMLFGAFLALSGLLETVADEGQGGETELADHRSIGNYVADRTHDRDDF